MPPISPVDRAMATYQQLVRELPKHTQAIREIIAYKDHYMEYRGLQSVLVGQEHYYIPLIDVKYQGFVSSEPFHNYCKKAGWLSPSGGLEPMFLMYAIAEGLFMYVADVLVELGYEDRVTGYFLKNHHRYVHQFLNRCLEFSNLQRRMANYTDDGEAEDHMPVMWYPPAISSPTSQRDVVFITMYSNDGPIIAKAMNHEVEFDVRALGFKNQNPHFAVIQ